MQLKGHATIELTDIHTGQVERYEEDNLVTNALSKIYNDRATLAATMSMFGYQYQLAPYNDFTDLMGGLFLFGEALEEDADKIFQHTTSDKIVGYANQTNVTIVDSRRGMINTEDSGKLGSGGWKHVWEFDSSHGNGTIAALALTAHMGGACGNLGYNVNTADGILFSNNAAGSQPISATVPRLWSAGNALYGLATEGTKIKLYNFGAIGTHKVGQVDSYENYLWKEVEEASTDYSAAPIRNNQGRVMVAVVEKEADKHYLYALELKGTELEKTQLLGTGDIGVQDCLLTNDGYLYLNETWWSSPSNSMGGTIARGKWPDFSDSENILAHSIAEYRQYINLTPDDMVYGSMYDSSPFSTAGENIYKPNNYGNYSNYRFLYKDNSPVMVSGANLYLRPTYLATINNLETPVTKTAAQSMKITYTLTYEE